MKPVRWSNLKWMAESPAHYAHYLVHPLKPSPVMLFGSLVHAMVLGTAPRSFVVYEGQRRGNAWKDFKAAHKGMEIVTTDEWQRASACADAAKLDPTCGPLLRQGIREQRITWDVGGRECAGTPDLNGGILIDLKVTPLARPERLPWHCRKMQWHAQLVWYLDGLEANGEQIKQVYLVAVTPKPPHMAVAYMLTERTIDLGRRQWRLHFERLRICERSDQWPGYAQDVLTLDLDEGELELNIDGEEVSL